MKSSDEEYLDSLLNSAQSNNNPQSALNRMASKMSQGNSGEPRGGESEGLSALIDNSSGNKEIQEVGSLLESFDRDELVDDKLANLLDNIQKPTNTEIPKFTVGGEPNINDVRDAEEIALDEAIADAEKAEAELKSSGASDSIEETLENIDIPIMPEPVPIIDESEFGDALAEMAPEIDLPEESSIITEKDSDADQTPEEILTDLLDDMPGSNLMDSQDGSESSLSDIIDRERNAEAAQNAGNGIDELSLDNMMDALMEQDTPAPQEETPPAEPAQEAPAEPEQAAEEPESKPNPVADAVADMPVLGEVPAEANVEELADSLAEALGMDMPAQEGETPEAPAAEETAAEEPVAENTTVTEEGIPELDALLNLLPDDNVAEEQAAEEQSAGAEETPAAEEQPAVPDAEPEINVTATDLGFLEEELVSKENVEDLPEAPVGGEGSHASVSIEEMSEDDINLNDLEANLDELLGDMGGDFETTEGEVAKIMGDEPAEASTEEAVPDSEDVSMPDLDALMNSLANDEVESIEDTAHLDKELGNPDGELPKEDILDALTETGFDDVGSDPALEAISALPPMDGSEDVDASEPGGGKKKKEGFFARLIRALTAEDEEEEDVGTEGLAGLTDENQQVLNELGEAEKPAPKPKKEKKKKEKKEKKPKPPKPKKEKPPKPKKEKKKKEKPPKDPGVPEKAIAPKKIALSGIFAASLGILVCIPAMVLPERISSERAGEAYKQEKYATAYKLLYGKEKTEDQTTVYEQSRVLAWAQRYLSGYENYQAMNMEVEALDMLLMSERNKANLMDEAAKFKVENQVRSVYDSIESLLSENYGLSELEIMEINSIKKERDYTIRIMEIVGELEP